jgi:DNA-directed RNA polymerase subunit E'/Rpb7
MSVFQLSVLTRKVALSIKSMGGDIRQLLHRVLVKELDGKCAAAGFVRPDSVSVIDFSCGVLKNENVQVTVTFSCDVAHPTVGDVLSCVVEDNTYAGLKCKLSTTQYDIEISPFVVFVARDHKNTLSKFSSIKVGDAVQVTVVGARFELHDAYISVIGTLTTDEAEGSEDELFEGTLQKYGVLEVAEVRANPEKTYVITDASKGKNKLIGEPNVLELRTAYRDTSFEANKRAIDADVDLIQQAKDVVFPAEFAEALKKEPETYAYLMNRLAIAGIVQETRDDYKFPDDEEEEDDDEPDDEEEDDDEEADEDADELEEGDVAED